MNIYIKPRRYLPARRTDALKLYQRYCPTTSLRGFLRRSFNEHADETFHSSCQEFNSGRREARANRKDQLTDSEHWKSLFCSREKPIRGFSLSPSLRWTHTYAGLPATEMNRGERPLPTKKLITESSRAKKPHGSHLTPHSSPSPGTLAFFLPVRLSEPILPPNSMPVPFRVGLIMWVLVLRYAARACKLLLGNTASAVDADRGSRRSACKE